MAVVVIGEQLANPAPPALGQQLPQVPGVGLVGLGVPLAAAGERRVGRLGQVRLNLGCFR